MLWLLYLPVSTEQKAGWAPSLVRMIRRTEKSLAPARIRTLKSPVRIAVTIPFKKFKDTGKYSDTIPSRLTAACEY
jgi:hypothetical protein